MKSPNITIFLSTSISFLKLTHYLGLCPWPARGDFVRLVLDPRVGRERSGERPALVLSGREFNNLTGYIFAAPVTGSQRGWPFEIQIPRGGRIDGVVLADQTKSIDYVARHARYVEASPPGLVDAVLERVATILGF